MTQHNVYRGHRDRDGRAVVEVNGRPLTVLPSYSLRRHSGGFEFGYMGSGPAQLALAILLRECDEATALTHYHAFNRHTVARLGDCWELASADVRAALGQIDRERPTPAA
jgi:hypothetical protein